MANDTDPNYITNLTKRIIQVSYGRFLGNEEIREELIKKVKEEYPVADIRKCTETLSKGKYGLKIEFMPGFSHQKPVYMSTAETVSKFFEKDEFEPIR